MRSIGAILILVLVTAVAGMGQIPLFPLIDGFSPTSGPPGTEVTITGTRFGFTQGDSTVQFNGVTASVTSWSDSTVSAVVPAGATTGPINITVNGVGTPSGSDFTVTAAGVPVISSLSPTSGTAGTSVTITGSNFGATQGSVKFNGTTATISSWSNTSIIAAVPAGATTGNVVVTAAGGVSSNGVSFTVLSTPSISSLTPNSGAVGSAIVIAGSNFGATQGTSTIKFNGTTATASSWSNTSITAAVPTGATTGNVVVTVSGVASAGASFTVVAAPSITSMSASSGPVGASVTITGSNFGATQGNGSVKFNGTTATVSSWSNTSIAVTVPTGATTGNVVVTAAGGVSSNGVSFTVLSTPTISSLTPNSGAVGSAIVIAGSNFGATQGTSTIKFNGTTATTSSWSSTSITAAVPTGATTGNVVVTVSGIASAGASFTVVPAPSITSLSPTSAPIGASVTITGSNFGATQGNGSVKFNGTTATVSSWSNTSIIAAVPAGATTGNVVVTAAGGISSPGVAFTIAPPLVSNVSPTSGTTGTSVAINGTGFGTVQGSVTFNGTPAAPTTMLWGPIQIIASVPAAATTGNVVVTNASGLSSTNPVVFIVLPAINTLSPNAAGVGDSITINGSGFGTSQGTSFVTFGTTRAVVTNWTTNSIVVAVPDTLLLGANNVVVTVGGNASNSSPFTVVAPKMTGLTPSSAPIGAIVTINGSGFGSSQGTSRVTFNNTAAIPTSWTSNQIQVAVPNGATSGNVVVTTTNGATNGFPFTVLSNVTALSLHVGPPQVGFVITGTSFGAQQPTSKVTIGSIVLNIITWGDTSITVQVPANTAPTNGNVLVTAGGNLGQGSNNSFSVAPAFGCGP